VGDNKVKVAGTKFVPTDGYFVKLEGVRKVGYRTISCAGVMDPVMIAKIDEITAEVKKRVKNNFEHYGFQEFFLDFKIYGKGVYRCLMIPEVSPKITIITNPSPCPTS